MSDKSDLVILQKTNRGRDKENPTWKHEMTKKDSPMMNKDSRYPLISVRNGYKGGQMGNRGGFLLTRDQ